MIIHCRSYTNICCNKNLLYTGSHGVVSRRHTGNFVCNHKRCRFLVFRNFALGKINALKENLCEKQFFKTNIWRPQKERQWWNKMTTLKLAFLFQFLLELCLFVNLEYSKYTVFRTFLLHALTYWAEILHITFSILLYYRSSSSVVNLRQILWELCPFWNLEYWKYTVFRTFLLHPLTNWAESLHITLFFCTTDQFWVSSICVYFWVMPLFEFRIL